MKRRILIIIFISWSLSLAPKLNAQWWPVLLNDSVDFGTLAASGTDVYAGYFSNGDTIPPLFHSTDYGITWQPYAHGLWFGGILDIAVIDTFVYAGVLPYKFPYPSDLYRTPIDSDNWVPVTFPHLVVNDMKMGSMAAGDSDIYIGSSYGFIISPDKGATWQTVGLNKKWITSFAIDSTEIFAFTQKNIGGAENHLDSIFLSSDHGFTWEPVMNTLNDSPGGLGYIAAIGNNLIVGTNYRVYRSTNRGTTWQEVDDPRVDQWTTYIFSDGSNFFVANLNGIFISTNYGATWLDTQLPFTTYIWSMARSGNLLLACVSGKGIYIRDLTPFLSVGAGKKILPRTITLKQNYPNPFNPTTTISFSLPTFSQVKLSVYNLVGQLVQNVVDGMRAPGNYDMPIDGSRWSSGLYFYRMQVGRFVQTKKMVLCK